jgi:hypothetical protein
MRRAVKLPAECSRSSVHQRPRFLPLFRRVLLQSMGFGVLWRRPLDIFGVSPSEDPAVSSASAGTNLFCCALRLARHSAHLTGNCRFFDLNQAASSPEMVNGFPHSLQMVGGAATSKLPPFRLNCAALAEPYV